MAAEDVDIVLGAGLFASHLTGREHPAALEMNRLRVIFRIVDQQIQV